MKTIVCRFIAGLGPGLAGGLALLLGLFAPATWAAGDAALVTSLQGRVERAGAALPVEAFVKLKEGDRLTLDKGARLQLVYFESARQETWSEAGALEIGANESISPEHRTPEVKKLPTVLVKQLTQTPQLDAQGRSGAVRLRSIVPPNALSRIDETYRKLRSEADGRDLSPEMYRLSALFEIRKLDKLEDAIGELRKNYSGDPEVERLADLYTKALLDSRLLGTR